MQGISVPQWCIHVTYGAPLRFLSNFLALSVIQFLRCGVLIIVWYMIYYGILMVYYDILIIVTMMTFSPKNLIFTTQIQAIFTTTQEDTKCPNSVQIKKCPNAEFFWSVFGHFSRSVAVFVLLRKKKVCFNCLNFKCFFEALIKCWHVQITEGYLSA